MSITTNQTSQLGYSVYVQFAFNLTVSNQNIIQKAFFFIYDSLFPRSALVGKPVLHGLVINVPIQSSLTHLAHTNTILRYAG